MKILLLVSLFSYSIFASDCQLEPKYKLELCIYDSVVNINNLNSHYEDERMVPRGEVTGFTEEGAVVVKMIISFPLGNDKYIEIEDISKVDPKALAKVVYPISDKYPGDFFEGKVIHETLYKGEKHPGYFITSTGLKENNLKSE